MEEGHLVVESPDEIRKAMRARGDQHRRFEETNERRVEMSRMIEAVGLLIRTKFPEFETGRISRGNFEAAVLEELRPLLDAREPKESKE